MLYLIQADGIGHVKVGFTAEDAGARLAQLQTGSPVPLRLLGTLTGCVEDEAGLHRRFAAYRVHGEWFKPVPELVAMFAAAPVPECGVVTVSERCVTIRALTVGRKQFSKALLDQLPSDECLCWGEVISVITGLFDRDTTPALITKYVKLPDLLHGNTWGWVKGGYDEVLDADNFSWKSKYRYIVFENEGRLFKQKDYDASPVGKYRDLAPSLKQVLGAIHRERFRLPGWGVDDQLFFGV